MSSRTWKTDKSFLGVSRKELSRPDTFGLSHKLFRGSLDLQSLGLCDPC